LDEDVVLLDRMARSSLVTAEMTSKIILGGSDTTSLWTTAAAPAREVEAVVRSSTNMAAAKIVAVAFSKMTSK